MTATRCRAKATMPEIYFSFPIEQIDLVPDFSALSSAKTIVNDKLR